jgi:hypothetical protein
VTSRSTSDRRSCSAAWGIAQPYTQRRLQPPTGVVNWLPWSTT